MAHLRGGGVGVVPRGDEWGGLKNEWHTHFLNGIHRYFRERFAAGWYAFLAPKNDYGAHR